MTPIRLLVARLRQDRLPVVLLVLVVALTAFLAASAPRLLLRTADAGLRHEVATASVVERNLQLGRITDIAAGPTEGMGPVLDVAREVEDCAPGVPAQRDQRWIGVRGDGQLGRPRSSGGAPGLRHAPRPG